MSNLYNLQAGGPTNDAITHHVRQTKHKNMQTMESKKTCFCEESFIDRWFLDLKILRVEGKHFVISSPIATQAENPMVNRVNRTEWFCHHVTKIYLQKLFLFFILCRGVARNFLEGSSNSSKILSTMVDWGIKFWVPEQLKQ